ncbi:hypothetical protein FSP39_008377 [Pinctada imbricata]|uniref:Carboxypeptidase n=1 Tax=Pinctada imbricata TaxID=66713 RepID=A0AA88XPU2_PINIB|nr:hypothetical protein FSP39_008377 [Pinctada imbricata]
MRVVISLYLLVAVRAAPAEDEVTLPLPGLGVQLPWKHYSGYLNGTGDRKLHYWFIQSANPEPQYDPLVLWLNGGPGCSSMVGLLLEHGPFKLQADGNRLEMNPFSWNKVANMLYLEAPVGVGYSYTDKPIKEYTDSIVAMDNYKALSHFFKKFPELKRNEFFMAGESYGGFYVPTLSEFVLNDLSINFKGFAVGNGLTKSIVQKIRHRSVQNPDKTGTKANKQKPPPYEKKANSRYGSETRCPGRMKGFVNSVTKLGVNIYDLYAKCSGDIRDTFLTQDELKNVLYWREVKGGYHCFDSKFLEKYMNKQRVREALHIPDRLKSWTTCSDPVYSKYNFQNRNVFKEFRFALNNQKRLLVYNGDVDPLVTYQSNQWFIDDLDLKETKPYTAWGLKDEMGNLQNAGFWNEFGNLRFVTIKPSELEVKETTETNNSASYLDIMLSYDTDGHMNTSLYDKRDDFDFSIINFPFLSSNIPSSPAYGVFISHLIHYARASTKYTDFVLTARRLSDKLLSQGYVCDRLTSSLRRFYGRYGELVIHYDVPLSRMVDDILS